MSVPVRQDRDWADLARRSHRTRRVRSLQQHIERVLASTPPPTREDRDRLANLLRPDDGRPAA